MVHRYNTRARRLKGQNLMPNNVATITTPRQPTTSLLAYTVHRTGEEWAHTNKTTGEVTIYPGEINAVICTDTGKYQ